ncbi:MAG TPA: 5-formyltetrahydrofolate cyclo-ligase [Microbacteriaceae bacterium]|nr:5-formyltetrahydrofolate cyclo-ligase [Microbacteriaceae bacterium]
MPPDPVAQKRALRAEIRERRRIMPAADRERAAEAITRRLIELAERRDVASVAAYLSTPVEPSTRGFLAWALEAGVRVLLPISRSDGLLDWAPYDGKDEDLDWLGMPQPTSEILSPLAVNDVDLILVPAAAVDRTGMRMGWGRGYFDRTLGSMGQRPPVYAIVFDSELVDTVPSERQDEPVDGAVTPSATVTFPID